MFQKSLKVEKDRKIKREKKLWENEIKRREKHIERKKKKRKKRGNRKSEKIGRKGEEKTSQTGEFEGKYRKNECLPLFPYYLLLSFIDF